LLCIVHLFRYVASRKSESFHTTPVFGGCFEIDLSEFRYDVYCKNTRMAVVAVTVNTSDRTHSRFGTDLHV